MPSAAKSHGVVHFVPLIELKGPGWGMDLTTRGLCVFAGLFGVSYHKVSNIQKLVEKHISE